MELASWEKNKGLSCEQCKELVELGAKEMNCEECERPLLLPENQLAVEIYSFQPITPIPMTEGLVMLDLKAIEFLMNIYEVGTSERLSLLNKLSIYHDTLFRKDKIEFKGGSEEGNINK